MNQRSSSSSSAAATVRDKAKSKKASLALLASACWVYLVHGLSKSSNRCDVIEVVFTPNLGLLPPLHINVFTVYFFPAVVVVVFNQPVFASTNSSSGQWMPIHVSQRDYQVRPAARLTAKADNLVYLPIYITV